MEITSSNAYSLIHKLPSKGLFVKRQEGGFGVQSGGELTVFCGKLYLDLDFFLSTTDYEEWLKAFLQMEEAVIENIQILTTRPPTPQNSRQRQEPTTPVRFVY